ELGTEAVRRLTVKDLPVVVAIVCRGNDVYKLAREIYEQSI
ncbi:MAG TPA: TRZ/ATZ family protein, partial [Porphyromonadaceae bacterium]|nr:TRZ/ATZ family protein [Porphyromonadaceae bacterium]